MLIPPYKPNMAKKLSLYISGMLKITMLN